MPRIALIANPESGGGDADRVESMLVAAGGEVETYPIGSPGGAARSGAERIAVAGGDGSIGVAAELAASAGIPLAVIATGTANDFAARLGLPADVEEACTLAAGGTATRRLELARVCGRPFVNVAGAGLPPAAAAEAAELKESIGALAYPVGAVGAGLSAEPIECTALAGGRELFSGAAWQVSVASSGAFGGGAGFRADPGDGELDLIVIEHGSRARLVKHAIGLRLGDVEDQRGVVSARAAAVELRLDPGAMLNVDGELITAGELDPGGVLAFTAERSGFELITG